MSGWINSNRKLPANGRIGMRIKAGRMPRFGRPERAVTFPSGGHDPHDPRMVDAWRKAGLSSGLPRACGLGGYFPRKPLKGFRSRPS